MSALVQRGIAQGRPMALAVTIGLHAALVAGLLAMKVVEAVTDREAPPIDVKWLDEKKPPIEQPTESLDPKLLKPGTVVTPDNPVQLVFLEEAIALPPDPGLTRFIEEPTDPVTTAAVIPDAPLRHQALRPSDDFYPPQAIRMGAEGAAVVRACVDARGGLSGTPAVVKSSRQSLLDSAAIRWASEALRFQPATQGGVAIPACKEFRVNFRLH